MWIPERHAEPAAPHSIATAWVGSTHRLALSLGDWLATLNVPAESMGDEDEGRLLATPPAAHAPPEAPLFMSGQLNKCKAFLSERTAAKDPHPGGGGDASRTATSGAQSLGYTPSCARAVKELWTSPRRGR